MSQTKHKMSWNIRQSVVWLCREYDNALDWIKTERAKVWSMALYSGGQPKGNTISKQSEDKAMALLRIDDSFQNKLVQAVDQARLHIGDDIENDEIVEKLRSAIWISTLDGRKYPYEVHDLPTIYRDDFYERKRKFLKDVAVNMKLI